MLISPDAVLGRIGSALSRVHVADRCLAVWFVGWSVLYAWGGGLAWHFFVQGQAALGDLDDPHSGGLHLYAALPQLQIGPVALGMAWLFSPLGSGVSLILAQVFGAIAGVAILLVTVAIARDLRRDLSAARIAWQARLVAVFFAPVWLYLAVGSAHLDDVLALLFGVLAARAVQRQQAVLAGLFLGLAVDAKPWALAFAAMLLLLAGPRARVLGLSVFAGTVGACWLPFLVADGHTLDAARFTIANTPHTALRVLGVTSARTPSWDRPAQALLGLLLALAAIRHGRGTAVILLAVASRLVLDPGTNLYYPAGAVVGAVVWDLTGSTYFFPWWTASSAIALYAARHLAPPLPPSTNGWLTLGFFLACVLMLVITGPSRRITARSPSEADSDPMTVRS